MISAKPWRLEAVARLFLGVIITMCAGMIVAGILASAKLGLSDEQLEFWEMVFMVACFQGAALIWVAVFLRQSNISWREAFGLRPVSRTRVVLAGVVTGIAALPVLWLLQLGSEFVMERLHLEPVAQAAVKELQNSALPAPEIIVFGVFTILLAPIAEETLFRGILYPTIKQMGYPRWALWGTSVAFGVMHLNLGSLVPLILLAVVLVLLYEATDSLLAPIATHCIFNAVNFFYLIFQDPINRLLHIS